MGTMEYPTCEELVPDCRKCERHFEPHERMVNCPECGDSRHCGQPRVKGEKFCRHHGAPQPNKGYYGRGAVATTGRQSKSRLVRLAYKITQIESDPVLASIGPLDTILASRMMELIDRVDWGDVPERMEALQAAWREFKTYHPHLDQYFHNPEAKKSFEAIDKIFETTYHDYAAWDQILKLVDEKRKLSETRLKHLKEMRALIPADDAYNIVAKLLAGIMKVVNDPNTIKAIQYEFAKIIGEEDIGGPEPGGGEVIDLDTSSVDRTEFLHTGNGGRPESGGENTLDPLSEGLPE